MNKNKLLFISTCMLILCMVLSAFRTVPPCSIKYDGIYAVKLDKEHSAVLRFYPDGTVLASTSVNDYMDVFTWFHKANKEMVLFGNYKLKGCEVSFSVAGSTGRQYYNGDVSEGSIYFRLVDKESKRGATRTYTYVNLGK